MTSDKLLISLVRRNPALYDKRVNDFRNKTKREAIWKGIAACLSISVEKAQARWITLRTLFCRELRARKRLGSSLSDTSQELGRKGWPLFDLMMFIKPFQRAGGKTTTYIEPASLNCSIATPAKVWCVESCQSWSADDIETPKEAETSNDGSNQHHYQPLPTIATTSSMQLNHIPVDPLREQVGETSKMEGVFLETTTLMKETIALLSSHQRNGNEGVPKTVPDAEVAAMVKVLQYPLLRVPAHLRTLCLTELLTVVHKYEENSS